MARLRSFRDAASARRRRLRRCRQHGPGAVWPMIARSRGGRIIALTVDHRLRPEAAAEAAQVAAWLGARGIAHRTLVRRGRRRAATSRLRRATRAIDCSRNFAPAPGVLHLLTAHHREDQGETLLLRLARGSGLDGFAAIAAVSERAACRVLRPLLGVARARLAATLAAMGQPWIEDPSNLDPAYARVRLRRAAAVLAARGSRPNGSPTPPAGLAAPAPPLRAKSRHGSRARCGSILGDLPGSIRASAGSSRGNRAPGARRAPRLRRRHALSAALGRDRAAPRRIARRPGARADLGRLRRRAAPRRGAGLPRARGGGAAGSRPSG